MQFMMCVAAQSQDTLAAVDDSHQWIIHGDPRFDRRTAERQDEVRFHNDEGCSNLDTFPACALTDPSMSASHPREFEDIVKM